MSSKRVFTTERGAAAGSSVAPLLSQESGRDKPDKHETHKPLDIRNLLLIGATIVLVAAGMFLATLLFNRFRRCESLAMLATKEEFE